MPVNDPTQLAVIGAAVTKHIGFGVTAGVPFEHPYPFAANIQCLYILGLGRLDTATAPDLNAKYNSSQRH